MKNLKDKKFQQSSQANYCGDPWVPCVYKAVFVPIRLLTITNVLRQLNEVHLNLFVKRAQEERQSKPLN